MVKSLFLAMIKALIFDFDGLILDTETPDFESWRDVYREFGHDLSLEVWGQIVGGFSASDFRPLPNLEALLGRDLTPLNLHARVKERNHARILALSPLPGVLETLQAARRLGLRLAVASSSRHGWVDGHLTRLGLDSFFETVKCSEDVSQTKPEPELYLSALAALRVSPHEAVAFEDSPHGVTAARRAGIFVIAVPNQVTAQLEIVGENLRLRSLADLDLGDFLSKM
jgi:HAD superfamily hydrolase (TIGR01509 family)